MTKKMSKTMRLEEIVVYVNQRASFLDTKTSSKSWCKTDPTINYKRIMFHFTTYDALKDYWKKLRDTCIKTPLGMTSERKVNKDGEKADDQSFNFGHKSPKRRRSESGSSQ